jgi:hypothetical protein
MHFEKANLDFRVISNIDFILHFLLQYISQLEIFLEVEKIESQNFFLLLALGAIQIIRDTFSALFRPPPPPV